VSSIVLVCATQRECEALDAPATWRRLVCGIGPVEAAARTAAALAHGGVRLVVNAGIAGALGDGIAVGASTVVESDAFDLRRENGDALALPPDTTAVERVAADARLSERLRARGIHAARGITVARPTTSARTARRLAASGFDVESMEGFAVLRAAQLAGVRAIQLRGISNHAGPPREAGWNVEAGLEGCRRAMAILIEALAAADAW
jgi:futalosine hydrolase